jgi:protease-4
MVANLLGGVVKLLFYSLLALTFLSLLGGVFSAAPTGGMIQQPLFGSGPDSVVVINIYGTMYDDPSVSSSLLSGSSIVTPKKVFMMLDSAKNTENVKAVVLRINSPGGTTTAAEEIYQMLVNFKKETKLPLYASLSEVAASGGYYIALAADEIIADATTLTGSIGVIAGGVNYSKLANDYGIFDVSVVSGGNKSFLNPLEPVSEEQVAILQTIVDSAYAQFIERVKNNRSIPDEIIATYADGRILSGLQAYEYGLVDSIDTFIDALVSIREKLGYPDARVVEYRAGDFWGSFLQAFSKPDIKLSIFPDSVYPMLEGKVAYMYLP